MTVKVHKSKETYIQDLVETKGHFPQLLVIEELNYK